MLKNILKQAQTGFRRLLATFRGVSCWYCGSLNLTRTYWEYVDPQTLPEALYIDNNSLAKRLGSKWAGGAYLKEPSGDIFTTREEIYHCHDCDNDSQIRREFVRTGE